MAKDGGLPRVCPFSFLRPLSLYADIDAHCLQTVTHLVVVSCTLLKDEESARDNHVLACNFAKYSPTLKTFH